MTQKIIESNKSISDLLQIIEPKGIIGRWARMIESQPESTAILGNYHQKSQKWRQIFTQSDREFFHKEAGDLLIKLGYEESDNWV